MNDRGIEAAFEAYAAALHRVHVDHDCAAWASHFTLDGVYRRPGHLDVVGRDAIAEFARTSTSTFPGNRVALVSVTWKIVDHRRQTVVFELRHQLPDPGDGSVHAASTVSMLDHAGDGLWSRCQDLCSPTAYAEMTRGWLRAAERHSPLLVEPA